MKFQIFLAVYLLFTFDSSQGRSLQDGLFSDLLNNTTTSTPNPPMKCPNGFIRFDEYCYKFISQHFSWIEALWYCKIFDMKLARIYSKEQYDFLQYHARSLLASNAVFTAGGFWVGATDANSPGTWEWVHDKQRVDFSRWGGSQPSTTAQCLGLSSRNSYQVTGLNCGLSALHPICQIRM